MSKFFWKVSLGEPVFTLMAAPLGDVVVDDVVREGEAAGEVATISANYFVHGKPIPRDPGKSRCRSRGRNATSRLHQDITLPISLLDLFVIRLRS